MNDPAFETVKLPDGVISLGDVPRDPAIVYAFDFDGVVVSPIEDAIYKLPPQPGETDALRRAAEEYGIRCGAMEPRYQRHLLFQEAARRAGREIPAGPGLALAQWAAANARTFFLTARSGWSATTRVRDFISAHLVPPIELYQLGRTSKSLQISLLCREFFPATVFYIEDSPAHLADAASLGLENLRLAFCSETVPEARVLELYRSVIRLEVDDGRSGGTTEARSG